MGLHWSYDQAKRNPIQYTQGKRLWRCWWVMDGVKDSNSHYTQADAEKEAAGLRELGIEPTVEKIK